MNLTQNRTWVCYKHLLHYIHYVKMKRFSVKKIVLWVITIVIASFVIYAHTIEFRASNREYISALANDTTSVSVDKLDYEGKGIRHILVERGKETLMVLIHGSPSSSAQWIPLAQDSVLGSKVDFLMIDRPGYGYSSFGNPILSVEKQAEITSKIIHKIKDNYSKVLLFGTSYGGTVSSRLLMDYPSLVDGAVLMSSSMAPGEERIYDISYLIEQIPWLFPRLIVVANEEKLSHYEELKDMEPFWDRIKSKLLFIHSTTDDLIYPSNIQFVLDKLNKKVPWDTVWVENGEHSLYWSDREFVKSQLNKFVDSFQPSFLKD